MKSSIVTILTLLMIASVSAGSGSEAGSAPATGSLNDLSKAIEEVVQSANANAPNVAVEHLQVAGGVTVTISAAPSSVTPAPENLAGEEDMAVTQTVTVTSMVATCTDGALPSGLPYSSGETVPAASSDSSPNTPAETAYDASKEAAVPEEAVIASDSSPNTPAETAEEAVTASDSLPTDNTPAETAEEDCTETQDETSTTDSLSLSPSGTSYDASKEAANPEEECTEDEEDTSSTDSLPMSPAPETPYQSSEDSSSNSSPVTPADGEKYTDEELDALDCEDEEPSSDAAPVENSVLSTGSTPAANSYTADSSVPETPEPSTDSLSNAAPAPDSTTYEANKEAAGPGYEGIPVPSQTDSMSTGSAGEACDPTAMAKIKATLQQLLSQLSAATSTVQSMLGTM